MRTFKAIAALAVAGMLAAGCGGSDDYAGSDAIVPTPAAFGPTYGGSLYCGYLYSPLECLGHPGIPVPFPGAGGGTALQTALWLHLLSNDRYYHSGYYYKTVIVTHHVNVPGGRDRFVRSSREFTTRNTTAVAAKRAPLYKPRNVSKFRDSQNGKSGGSWTRKTYGGGGGGYGSRGSSSRPGR